MGEHQKSINDCKKALELDPKYGKAYGRMGYVPSVVQNTFLLVIFLLSRNKMVSYCCFKALFFQILLLPDGIISTSVPICKRADRSNKYYCEDRDELRNVSVMVTEACR